MPNENLLAITPIDGRYESRTKCLSDYFSEFALIKTRVEVEINWLILISNNKSLSFIPNLSLAQQKKVLNIFNEFSIQDAREIKKIEKKTNHDVKAIELFIVAKLKKLSSLAKKWSKISMLAFTHGQPASPTTLGKEFANYSYRLKFHLDLIKSTKQKGKFNGASGNYNAHLIASQKVNWESLSKRFVNSLGLNFSSHSTQIELKDTMAYQLTNIHNMNNVLIDFAQDIWLLISKNYLKQNLNAGEVGSSTMPHKVNPIDFENAEGNLSIANGLLVALKNKIQISRLQRDLSDSTVLRNLGSLFAYIIISLDSLQKGLAKIEPNKEIIVEDLDNTWEILTEAIQTLLRKNGIEDSYTKIKSISRGKKLDYHSYIKIIDDLKINKADKELLLNLTPKKYIGLADKLAKSSFKS